MNKLEEAINHIDAARRKARKSAAWNEADEAAKIAGIKAQPDPDRPNWPDLIRLEKEVRIALEDHIVIAALPVSAFAKWAASKGIRGIHILEPTPNQVNGKTLITCHNQIDLDILASALEVWQVDIGSNVIRKFTTMVVTHRNPY